MGDEVPSQLPDRCGRRGALPAARSPDAVPAASPRARRPPPTRAPARGRCARCPGCPWTPAWPSASRIGCCWSRTTGRCSVRWARRQAARPGAWWGAPLGLPGRAAHRTAGSRGGPWWPVVGPCASAPPALEHSGPTCPCLKAESRPRGPQPRSTGQRGPAAQIARHTSRVGDHEDALSGRSQERDAGQSPRTETTMPRV